MEIKLFSELCGEIIKGIRLKNKLSQEELATKSGLSRTFISRLERGLRQPSLYSIFLLSKALDIKSSQIISFMEDKFKMNFK